MPNVNFALPRLSDVRPDPRADRVLADDHPATADHRLVDLFIGDDVTTRPAGRRLLLLRLCNWRERERQEGEGQRGAAIPAHQNDARMLAYQ